MKKKNYLILLLIVWFEGWGLHPYGSLSGDTKFIVTLSVMLLGVFMYYTPAKRRVLKSCLMKPFWWIMAGIVLSMIPAYLYYGQSFTQSFITYRSQLLWFVIPLLFVVSPSEKDVASAAKWVTVFMMSVYYLRIFMPTMFEINPDKLVYKNIEDMYVEGLSIATIPIFYSLMLLRKKIQWKHLFIIVFCYAFLFIMQNRSALFPVTLLIVLSLWSIQSRYRYLLVSFCLIVSVCFIIQTADNWIQLFDETTTQLSNEDYNRNVAFHYYVFEANDNWLSAVLGNGFLSSNATTLMQDLMKQGIYNSDIGFVGFWNQYGIIPVIVFIWIMLIPLIRRKRYSWYLKLWALQMLMCALTTSYFGSHVHLIYFALYYYLFMLYYIRYDHNRTYQLSQRGSDSSVRS